jgi:hypothetical protein
MRSPQTSPDRQNRLGLRTLPDAPDVELLIAVGRARQRVRRVIGPVFLIGSSMDCDLILGDPLIPSVHSYILLTPTEVRIRHLGFAPELRINGACLELAALQDADAIEISSFTFLARIGWQTGESRPDDLPGPTPSRAIPFPRFQSPSIPVAGWSADRRRCS